MVLTGLAGTGKTTVLRYIYEHWKKAGRHVVVMAPTAKAAFVLNQKGVPATTIHKMIYYYRGQYIDERGREQLIFQDNEKQGIADVFAVDEASMVTLKQRKDIEARGIQTLWVGDPGQLPPVMSADNGLLAKPDYHLTEIHRQAEGNPIIRWAHALRSGAAIDTPFDGISHVRCENRGPSYVANEMIYRNIDRLVVKTNVQRYALNLAMRTALGKHGILDGGDEIICVRNNKLLGTINGQVFKVIEVIRRQAEWHEVQLLCLDDNRKHRLRVWNGSFGRPAKLEEDVEQQYMVADYAYAITCHKMQGSSAPHIGIAAKGYCGDSVKQWNYTAATRAEEEVTVFC
jgi:exodeoxyribonuclease-5